MSVMLLAKQGKQVNLKCFDVSGVDEWGCGSTS